MMRHHMMRQVFEALRSGERVEQLHDAPLTIDLLADRAYELFRQRQEDIEGSNKVVDVFSCETYFDLMVRRACGWCRNKYGAPMKATESDNLIPANILHTDRVGLAFVGDPFGFCRPGGIAIALLFINDLIWCHDHYEVQSLKKHLIIEDFS